MGCPRRCSRCVILLAYVGCIAALPISAARADSVMQIAAAGYPVSTLPTVVPLRDRRHSLTLAGSIGVRPSPFPGAVGGAQIAYYAQFWRALDVGLLVGGGLPTAFTAGAMVRPRFEVGRVAMGLQIEGGFLFAGGLAQLAVDVGRQVWLNGASGIRYRVSYLGIFVPVGLGVQFPATQWLDLVVQVEAQIEPAAIEFSHGLATLGFAWRLGPLPPNRTRKRE